MQNIFSSGNYRENLARPSIMSKTPGLKPLLLQNGPWDKLPQRRGLALCSNQKTPEVTPCPMWESSTMSQRWMQSSLSEPLRCSLEVFHLAYKINRISAESGTAIDSRQHFQWSNPWLYSHMRDPTSDFGSSVSFENRTSALSKFFTWNNDKGKPELLQYSVC